MSDSKDEMLLFKSTKQGKNSKGADRLQLYMSVEEVKAVIEELKSKATERGAVFDVHTSFKESKQGTKFLSSFAFVRGIKEPSSPGGYKPKEDVAKSKIAALKGL